MSDEIRPAPVNWELLSCGLNYWGEMRVDHSEDGIVLRDADSPIVVRNRSDQRHALAALCLYQQPFGFTREDEDLLRGMLVLFAPGGDWLTVPEHDRLSALAARIAALLPPAEK